MLSGARDTECRHSVARWSIAKLASDQIYTARIKTVLENPAATLRDRRPSPSRIEVRLGHQPIADSWLGNDVLRTGRIDLELAAQACDIHPQ